MRGELMTSEERGLVQNPVIPAELNKKLDKDKEAKADEPDNISCLAIDSNPEIKPKQVLWYENMTEIIERNHSARVVDFACCRIMRNCNKPLWVFFHFGWNIIEYEIGRGRLTKALNMEDTIKAPDLAEISGLVNLTTANAGLTPGVVCKCCNDCCGPLEGTIRTDVVPMEYAPSRSRATVAEGLCTGDQTRIEHCPFGDIKRVEVLNSKKLKARVNKQKYMGCGLCVITCEPTVLIFKLVRPPEFIPMKPKVQHEGITYASVK